MARNLADVANHPQHGDIVEIMEQHDDGDGELYDFEVMLRVLAVQEGYVWFKEYGKGRPVVTQKSWFERLMRSKGGKVISLKDE